MLAIKDRPTDLPDMATAVDEIEKRVALQFGRSPPTKEERAKRNQFPQPTPLLTQLKAGETAYQADKVPKTL